MSDLWRETNLESPFGEAEQAWGSESPFGEAGREPALSESWAETPFGEGFAESWSESPFTESESPFAESEGFGSSEFESPFAESEGFGAAEFESPFAETWGEAGAGAGACAANVANPKHRKNILRPKFDAKNPGAVNDLGRISPVELRVISLSSFDVDDYRMKDLHRAALAKFVGELEADLRNKRYTGTIHVTIIGEASTTGTVEHNLALSSHRAYNVSQTFQCLLSKDLAGSFDVRAISVGEELARGTGSDSTEIAGRREVVIRAVAPIVVQSKPCPDCPGPTPPPTPNQLCVSVPRIEPRRPQATRPGVLDLRRVLPGMPGAPLGLVPNARAQVRVDSGGRTALYDLVGWGLEVAVPAQGGHVSAKAAISSSLDVLARAAGTVAGRIKVGRFGLSLRVDVNAFASLIVRLSAQVRIDLDIVLVPNVPEPNGCTVVPAQARSGALDLRSLAGTATLVVPPRGLGPAHLRFASPGIASGAVRLARNPVPVPADKSTVRNLLVIQGILQPPRIASQSSREAAFELPAPTAEWETGWEAEPAREAELLPFG